jgi:hypothetical protein
MRRVLFACLWIAVLAGAANAAEWQAKRTHAPARITALETVEGNVRVLAGGLWYQLALAGDAPSFKLRIAARRAARRPCLDRRARHRPRLVCATNLAL